MKEWSGRLTDAKYRAEVLVGASVAVILLGAVTAYALTMPTGSAVMPKSYRSQLPAVQPVNARSVQ